MHTIKTATRVAHARLQRARQDAGITDLQATVLSELIDEAIKDLERGAEANGMATLGTMEMVDIVRKAKGTGDGELSFQDRMLVGAIATAVATEFRAAGYAVDGGTIVWPKVTVTLVCIRSLW